MQTANDFDQPINARAPGPASRFVVDVDGYEGPIDVLLALARDQKVDLAHISILQLADQYLSFVVQARRLNLELAADYLVMAAWLAYLKSRLLLPDVGGGDEPTGAEMAAALAFQLRRLEAMQGAGARLMARSRLGRDFFCRGAPETFPSVARAVYQVGLFELLKSYGDIKRRRDAEVLRIQPDELYTIEDALERLCSLLGRTPSWESLAKFLPAGLNGAMAIRSALASTLAASLELARSGKIKLRQTAAFGPIFVRAVASGPESPPPGPARPRTL